MFRRSVGAFLIESRKNIMTKKFIDVASYQPDTLAYFKAVKAKGVQGVVVKITEGSAKGTNYVNPKAAQQIKNAQAVGAMVSGYHFLRSVSVKDAQEEAQFFARQAKVKGLNTKSMLAIDVEADSLSKNAEALTSQVNAFAAELRRLGFKNISVYSNTSWFTRRLIRSKLNSQIFWVASFGTNSAGIPCSAWQYSNKEDIAGVKTDISLDYSGAFTGSVGGKDTLNNPPQSNKKWVDELGVTWYQEKGTFVSNKGIFLRWGARTSSSKITLLPAGSEIRYDAFAHSGGYVWIRQPRADGKYGYMATGESKNGKRCSSWGKFK